MQPALLILCFISATSHAHDSTNHQHHQHHAGMECATQRGSLSQENLFQTRMNNLARNGDDDGNSGRRKLFSPSCTELCVQCIEVEVYFHLGALDSEDFDEIVIPHPRDVVIGWQEGNETTTDDFTSLEDMYAMIDANMQDLNLRYSETPFRFTWKNDDPANPNILLSTNSTDGDDVDNSDEWLKVNFAQWRHSRGEYNNSAVDNNDFFFVDDPKVLNVYLVHEICVPATKGKPERCGVFGGTSLPSAQRTPSGLDGIVMIYSALLNGGFEQYDGGVTLTHETGHWLGLLHTFHERFDIFALDGDAGLPPCDPTNPNDYVSDTPLQAGPSSALYKCSPTFYNSDGETIPDSCPDSPGRDAVFNYMNYVDDERCMPPGVGEFTCGQRERMHAQWFLYREHFEECDASMEMQIGVIVEMEVNFSTFHSMTLRNAATGVVLYNSTTDLPVVLNQSPNDLLEINLCVPSSSSDSSNETEYMFAMSHVLGSGLGLGGAYEIYVNGEFLERVTGNFGSYVETRIIPPPTSTTSSSSNATTTNADGDDVNSDQDDGSNDDHDEGAPPLLQDEQDTADDNTTDIDTTTTTTSTGGATSNNNPTPSSSTDSSSSSSSTRMGAATRWLSILLLFVLLPVLIGVFQ